MVFNPLEELNATFEAIFLNLSILDVFEVKIKFGA